MAPLYFVEVSIGYDVTYLRVEELLLIAGQEAKLKEPFVLVQELLDHAVVYRVCGFLPEMKNLLSARSNLRKRVLEQMHGNNVEIVSPSFMNQRALDPANKVIPRTPVMHDIDKPEEVSIAPEEMIFDKAEEAASLEELKLKQGDTRLDLKHERARLKAPSTDAKDGVQRSIDLLERQERRYADLVAAKTNGD